MNSGIALFITVAVVVNILAAVWLIWWTARGSKATNPQETTHVWDEDLTEYNNPLPRWWLWLFIISIVFGFVYLALYPGLGTFKGTRNWTQVSQWQAETQAANSALERRFAAFKGKSLTDLSNDAGAMSTARNLFALNCSTCHGSDARGAKGFPNLTDQDWLWGGSEEAIYQTVSEGRIGMMPAWGEVLGKDGTDNMVAYVLTLSGKQAPSASSNAGKAQFETICAACHGADGKGNVALGAPNLPDKIWLNGGSVADIHDIIANGRTNHMPPHLERLGETKVRLLAAYVLKQSQPTHDASP